MPRVTFVKKARHDNPVAKKGEPYYWWKFRFGGKHYSKDRPRASQLTQSEFWGNIYGLQESSETVPEFGDIETAIEDIKGQLEEWRDEIDEKKSNLESAFPNGCPSLETVSERYDALDSAISDLESVDVSVEYGDTEEDSDEAEELRQQRAEEIWSEVTDVLSSISCS